MCRYQSSVDCEDQERIDKLLAVLEQKDEMAQKMDSVKSLKVQVSCHLSYWPAAPREEQSQVIRRRGLLSWRSWRPACRLGYCYAPLCSSQRMVCAVKISVLLVAGNVNIREVQG